VSAVNAAVSARNVDGELDEVTLARAMRGEQAACRALVVRYQGPVFALLGRLLAGRRGALVEDLAQETFLRVFRALSSFTPSGAARLSTWILTIATRLALDELRRRPREAEPLEAAADARDPQADGAVERRDLGRAIQRAMAALSPDHQAIVLLRELHGLEYEEIARALDLDAGTVKSRLSRARAALRDALGDAWETRR
jgi:RNA polymerase sigma-70 factor (ECF subfamily)